VQASLVFDWIEGEWGFGAVREFLGGYRAGDSTEDIARRVLGLEPRALDAAFDGYVRNRFAGELRALSDGEGDGLLRNLLGRAASDASAGDLDALRQAVRRRPGAFTARLALGRALVAAGAHAEAEEHLLEADRLFPDYGGAEGPLRQLARIRRARGDLAAAADALWALGQRGESLIEVHEEEAELRRQLGDDDGERAALARIVEIAPLQLDPHRRLAELAAAAGDHAMAVRERRVVLGLAPPDRADAHYRLAVALRDAGQRDEARTQVIRALEIAPGYEAALDLLLELRRGGGGP
jgi:tetratricopeptide (TPR) repeat protein